MGAVREARRREHSMQDGEIVARRESEAKHEQALPHERLDGHRADLHDPPAAGEHIAASGGCPSCGAATCARAYQHDAIIHELRRRRPHAQPHAIGGYLRRRILRAAWDGQWRRRRRRRPPVQAAQRAVIRTRVEL